MSEIAYPSLIPRLKTLLPASSWQWIFPALRLDPLIWESLCRFEQVFGVEDLSEVIQHPDDCTPAALALKALKYPRSPQELRLLPLIPVEPAFRDRVEEAENHPLLSLSDAALKALNLRQKRHSTGSWDDWASTLQAAPLTALSCLFGMIPDQVEYLQALLPAQFDESDEESFQRLLKVILCNPAPPSVQSELMTILLRSLSTDEQEKFHQTLSALQPQLATHFSSNSKPTSKSPVEKGLLSTAEGMLNKIKTLSQQIPLALKIFDQREPNLKAQQLTQSIQLTSQTQALMLAKLAILSEVNGNTAEAKVHWQTALHLQPHSHTLRAMVLLSQVCSNPQNLLSENDSFIFEEATSPLLLLSYQICEGQNLSIEYSQAIESLKTISSQALEELDELAHSDPFLSDQEIQLYLLCLLSDLFIRQGFYALAHQVVSRILKHKADHPALLSLMAILLHAEGNHTEALNLLHLLEGYYPQHPILSALLAQSHAVNLEWQQALEILRDLTVSPTQIQIDYEKIAYAYHSGNKTTAVKLCHNALKGSPQDGIFLSLLAEIETHENPTSAIDAHEQAIELAPAEPYVWLAYARTAQRCNEVEKALHILKAAEQTLPKNPFIQCALGEFYLETSQPSLALPHFQTAVEMLQGEQPYSLPISVHQLLLTTETLPQFIGEINLRFNQDWGSSLITFDQWYGNLIAKFGETLQQLGHYQEARSILESTYQDYPYQVELAYQIARLDIAEGNFFEAGQRLKTSVLGKTNTPEVVVDFARCALEVENLATCEEVIFSLQQILEEHPDHFEALILLAQALHRSDQPQAALKLYDQILRFPQAREKPLHEKLAFDMSQAAIQAGEYELALTTLLECNLQHPLTQKQLAETYFHLGLNQEAAQAAKAVLSNSDEDVKSLHWYATFCKRLAQIDASHALDFYQDAIKALQKAVELDPLRSNLHLALGEALYQIGDRAASLQVFLNFTPQEQSPLSSTATATEFIQAAQYLNLLGEQDAALSCYEKCVTLLQTQPNSNPDQVIEVLQTIAEIYRQNHRYTELYETLQSALRIRPEDFLLFLDATAAWLEMHMDASRLQFGEKDKVEVLPQLEGILEHHPEEKQLLFLYALLLRWMGNHPKAIEVLNRLVSELLSAEDVLPSESHFPLLAASITELARLYRLSGEEQFAQYWLHEGVRKIELRNPKAKNEAVELYCDWLDVSLARGEDRQAILLDLCNKNPDHLRLIALMSRVKAQQGDLKGARMLFETVLAGIAEPQAGSFVFHPAIGMLLNFSRRMETLYTLADVAQQVGQWNLAIELLNQIIRQEPQTVRAHFERLQLCVLRAEYQLICQHLHIVTNAPGAAALEEEGQTAFETSAQSLQRNSSFTAQAEQLSKWILRGKLVFDATEDDLPPLGDGQISTELIGLRMLKASKASIQSLITAASPFQNHAILRFQIALSVTETHPHWAISLLEGLRKLSDGEILAHLPKKYWVISPDHFRALIGVALAQAVLQDQSVEGLTARQSTAAEALTSALGFYPDEPNWHLLAAQLAQLDSSKPENLQKAIYHLEKALTYNAQSVAIHLKLAQLHLSLQKPELAIQTLENASALDDENPLIDYWLAKAYLQAHQHDLAAQYAQAAMDKNPLNSDFILLRGEIALQMQDAVTALQLAEQALEHPTEDPHVWSLFARALHAAGKGDDAIRVLEQTIPHKPEFLDLHLERIVILRQWRGAEAALQEIETLLESFPQAISLLINQAEILAELGKTEPAISAAQTALRLSHQATSNVSLEKHAQSHRLLGELFYRSGHLDQSVYHLSEAINLIPSDASTYLTLGDLYLSRGENERALAAYQRCLSIDANNSRAYFKSGILYKEMKDYPNAEQMLRHAAKLEPDNLAIQRQLGAVVALNLIHIQRTKEKKNL